MWVVSDNLLKGAALNTVQIAEKLMTDYLQKFRLDGKTAFVVGGLGLIGSEVSSSFASVNKGFGSDSLFLSFSFKYSISSSSVWLDKTGKSVSALFLDKTRLIIIESLKLKDDLI